MPDTTYTHGHDDSVLRSHRWRTAANSAAYLLPRLRPGSDLLDVGCGPGTITADLARAVAPGRVVGIDAARRGGGRGPGRGRLPPARPVTFEVADLFALPFADDSFDVVHAHQVLQHVADPVAALVEMRRVCRPGGVVAARDADYPTFTFAPAEPDLDRAIAAYGELTRVNRAHWDAGTPPARPGPMPPGSPRWRPSASVWCFATAGGPGLVGRPVGRPVRRSRLVRSDASCESHGHRRSGRPRGVRRRLAAVGGLAGRMVRRAPRRDPGHLLS